MSYILEALKKSQQERSRGQVPDLQTLHSSAATADPSSPRWLYWALALTLLALAFLLGWLRPWSTTSNPSPVVPVPVIEPVTRQTPRPEQPAVPARPAAVPTPSAVISESAPANPQPVIREAVDPDLAADSVAVISQLPSLLQQSIPQLQFAGHVYSSNPLQRSVIINGRAMSEGDELMSGMTLQHITPDSVIFNYQGRNFKVAVLHDWSFK